MGFGGTNLGAGADQPLSFFLGGNVQKVEIEKYATEIILTRWYFQIVFLFPPRNLGKLDQFDEVIFQTAWFKHQQTCQSFLQIFPICKGSGTFFPIKNLSEVYAEV